MNIHPLSREQVREIDRRAAEDFAMPGVCLMENAGRGVADLLERLGMDGPVVICAGKGNNGGDGFVIARHLEYRGYPVRVLLCAQPGALQGDAAINYTVIQRSGIEVKQISDVTGSAALDNELAAAGWIVDGLLGTGLRGAVRSPYAEVIAAVNAASAPVLAVDLPSGLDCDTGQPLGIAVRAAHTATFVAPKQGFAAAGACEYTGQVHVLDIGAPRRLLEQYASHNPSQPTGGR